jgi:hypothetical protein
VVFNTNSGSSGGSGGSGLPPPPPPQSRYEELASEPGEFMGAYDDRRPGLSPPHPGGFDQFRGLIGGGGGGASEYARNAPPPLRSSSGYADERAYVDDRRAPVMPLQQQQMPTYAHHPSQYDSDRRLNDERAYGNGAGMYHDAPPDMGNGGGGGDYMRGGPPDQFYNQGPPVSALRVIR